MSQMLAPARLLELIRDPRISAAAVANATTALTKGLSAANQKLSSCCLSQAFEDRHFTEREISFETLNEVRRIWTAASGLEDSAKTPPDFRAGSASHRNRASKIATPSALSLSRRSPSGARDRGLRLVALVLPLGEQRQLVHCPIGPSGWHGRRVAFVRRKCFEHFVSIVRIGHEGVFV